MEIDEQEPYWASRVPLYNWGAACQCPGHAPGLNGVPCNRPALPETGFCSGCSVTGCWCSCRKCDPSSSSSGKECNEPSDKSFASRSSEGNFVCTPGGPQELAPRLCICDLGHGDEIFRCVHEAVEGTQFCADCADERCRCTCVHCDPVVVLAPVDDYDLEGRVYFNPATHNRYNIDPPRCRCTHGAANCEFVSVNEAGFCDRCLEHRCMCPCRGCDPDNYNLEDVEQYRRQNANATPPQI